MLKIEKFTDICMTGGITQSYKHLQISQFSTSMFLADITPEMLKLCRFTKVKAFFLVLVDVFSFS